MEMHRVRLVAVELVLFMLVGALPAASFGARMTERVQERSLDYAIASVMLVAAVSQLWKLLS